MVSFKRTLDKVYLGDFTRKVYLRRRDFFKMEASKVNETLDRISTMVSTVQSCHQEILHNIDNVSESLGQDDEIHNIHRNIAEQIKIARKELSKIEIIESSKSNSEGVHREI